MDSDTVFASMILNVRTPDFYLVRHTDVPDLSMYLYACAVCRYWLSAVPPRDHEVDGGGVLRASVC